MQPGKRFVISTFLKLERKRERDRVRERDREKFFLHCCFFVDHLYLQVLGRHPVSERRAFEIGQVALDLGRLEAGFGRGDRVDELAGADECARLDTRHVSRVGKREPAVLHLLQPLHRAVLLEHAQQDLVLIVGAVADVNLVRLTQLHLLLHVGLHALGQTDLAARERDLGYGLVVHGRAGCACDSRHAFINESPLKKTVCKNFFFFF